VTNGGSVLPAIVGTLSGIGDVGAAGSGQLVTQFTHTSSSLTARNNQPNMFRLFASFLTVRGVRLQADQPGPAKAGHPVLQPS